MHLAGGPFNVASPKQLGEVLFERLGLPRGRKTKTGWSTDVEVLTKLAAEQPIAARILELPLPRQAQGHLHATPCRSWSTPRPGASTPPSTRR